MENISSVNQEVLGKIPASGGVYELINDSNRLIQYRREGSSFIVYKNTTAIAEKQSQCIRVLDFLLNFHHFSSILEHMFQIFSKLQQSLHEVSLLHSDWEENINSKYSYYDTIKRVGEQLLSTITCYDEAPINHEKLNAMMTSLINLMMRQDEELKSILEQREFHREKAKMYEEGHANIECGENCCLEIEGIRRKLDENQYKYQEGRVGWLTSVLGVHKAYEGNINDLGDLL